MQVDRESPQRLFFALWPPEAVQAEMAAFRDAVLGHARHARAVPQENLHLTLAFLGATDATVRDCYEAAAGRVAAPAMSLHLDTAGLWRRSGVVWCGCETVPPALAQLHRALIEALADCGYRAETRPFAAHVTLARNVRHVDRPLPNPALRWDVREFCLVKSITGPDGARYAVLRQWLLGVVT